MVIVTQMTGRRGGALGAWIGLLLSALWLPVASAAETVHLELKPATTRIEFELGATLHTVRGRFELDRAELALDLETGALTGRVVVDARSGDTGNGTRDANMHEQVLESERHPEIVLLPERIVISEREEDRLAGELVGAIEIHGGRQGLRFPLEAVRTGPGRGRVSGAFDVPYVAWGMRDLSNFVLRVDDTLRVTFTAEGALRFDDPAPPRP